MKIFRSPLVAAALGAASWTGTEYGLHRFAMHVMRGRGLASVEHLKHHADVTYFSSAPKKIASAAGTTAVAFPLVTVLAGRRCTTAFTVGLVGTADDPGVITVPRRMAPVWMLDDAGEVRPELVEDYLVNGAASGSSRQVEQDRADAFANVAPQTST